MQVEVNKDRNLVRRIQSLQRFLLEQLHRDMLSRSLPPKASPALQEDKPHASEVSSDLAPDRPSEPLLQAITPMEQVFGMRMRQRMRCLSGDHAEALRETRTFQVTPAGSGTRWLPCSIPIC